MNHRFLRPGPVALSTLLAALAAGLLAASHAGACSCVLRSPAEAFAAADVVFTGRAISRTPLRPGRSGQPAVPSPGRSRSAPFTWLSGRGIALPRASARARRRLTASLRRSTRPHPKPCPARSAGSLPIPAALGAPRGRRSCAPGYRPRSCSSRHPSIRLLPRLRDLARGPSSPVDWLAVLVDRERAALRWALARRVLAGGPETITQADGRAGSLDLSPTRAPA